MAALLDRYTLYGIALVNPAIQGLNVLGGSGDFAGCSRERTVCRGDDRGYNMYQEHREPEHIWYNASRGGFLEYSDVGGPIFVGRSQKPLRTIPIGGAGVS